MGTRMMNVAENVSFASFAFATILMTVGIFIFSPVTHFQFSVAELVAFFMIIILAWKNRAICIELAQWRQQLAQTHDAIIVRTMDGVITHWNEGASALYGWSVDEAVGTHLSGQICDPSIEHIRDQLLQYGFWEGEQLDTRRDGTHITVSSRWALKCNTKGEPSVIISTSKDITHHKQIISALLETQSQLAHLTRVTMLGEFAASIAHEVNQPLTAITTNAEACVRWLDRHPPNVKEVQDAIAHIINDSVRAHDVIKHIRALSRKSAPECAALNLNSLLEDALSLLRRELLVKKIVLTLRPSECGVVIKGDRIQLQQVIINLVINAIQAMEGVNDRPKELLVRARYLEPSQASVEVRDSGPGIAEEHLSLLFDSFFTTKADGMGMGLSVCRSIIESHGGRIAASNHSEQGAVIMFSVPAQART